MIPVNELRRGNRVFDENEVMLYVFQIFNNGVELSEDMIGSEDLDYEEKEIFPIPLTPEILERCGFKKHTFFGLVYDFENFYLSYQTRNNKPDVFELIPDGHDASVTDITEKCKYLHQLQNLVFALSFGKELEIKF